MQVTLYLLTSHTSPEHLRSDVEAFVDASLPAVAGSEHRAAMLDRVRHVASPPQASAGGSRSGLHTDTDEELGHRGSYLHPGDFEGVYVCVCMSVRVCVGCACGAHFSPTRRPC